MKIKKANRELTGTRLTESVKKLITNCLQMAITVSKQFFLENIKKRFYVFIVIQWIRDFNTV